MKTCRLWKISKNEKSNAYLLVLKEPKKMTKEVFKDKNPIYYFDPLIDCSKEKNVTQNMEKLESGETLKSNLTYYSVAEGKLVYIVLICDFFEIVKKLIHDDSYIGIVRNGNSEVRIMKERIPYHNPWRNIVDPDKNIYSNNQKLLDGLVIIENDKTYHFGLGSFHKLCIMMDEAEKYGHSES